MDNDNRGALFRNQRREKETHPTHTGMLTVAGIDYYLDAWVQEKNGEKYFSVRVKPKPGGGAPLAETKPPLADDLDDEIPWG